MGLFARIVAIGGDAIVLGATDTGNELMEERLEAVSALSRAISASLFSLSPSVAEDSS